MDWRRRWHYQGLESFLSSSMTIGIAKTKGNNKGQQGAWQHENLLQAWVGQFLSPLSLVSSCDLPYFNLLICTNLARLGNAPLLRWSKFITPQVCLRLNFSLQRSHLDLGFDQSMLNFKSIVHFILVWV